MKILVWLRPARSVRRSGAREVLQIAPLACAESERLRRLALASGFRPVRSFGIDRSAALARGGARVGEPGLGSGLSLYFTISRDRGFIDRKKYKRGRKPFLAFGHPTLPFGFEIGKINKYAGLNFANLTTKVPMRIVVGAGKMDWLINHS
jgi:hypothetical protein